MFFPNELGPFLGEVALCPKVLFLFHVQIIFQDTSFDT
jgi:hypothetical protein